MPRRTPTPPPDALGMELPETHLNVPAPTHHRESWEDPLKPMVGASPTVEEKRRPGRPRKDDPRSIAKVEAKKNAERYERYIDVLVACGGDKANALSIVFNVSLEEAQLSLGELHAEVLKGLGSSSVGEILKNQDLTKAGRIALLKRHAYSPNPAASLKAIDMIGELDNDKHDQTGRYENYLSIILGE